jgi:hypothetical protein
MNGRVNTVNKYIIFRIIPENNLYKEQLAVFDFPNTVSIFLHNMVLQYDDMDYTTKEFVGFDRYGFICTQLAFTICHELYHADQNIERCALFYNAMYFDKSEIEVDAMAHSFIAAHRKYLERLAHCKFSDPLIDSVYDESEHAILYDYSRTTIEDLYVIGMDTCVFAMEKYLLLTDRETNKQYEVVMSDYYKNRYSRIVVSFAKESCRAETVVIKKDGMWVAKNLKRFQLLINRYMDDYQDFYKKIKVRECDSISMIVFELTFSDYEINPFITRDKMAILSDTYMD